MNCARHQLFAGPALARNQYRCARIFEPGNHAHHVLNVRRTADNAVELIRCGHALPQELIFGDQVDFLRHALEQQAHLFNTKGLLDVVVRSQLHGINGGFDGAMTSHDGHFRMGQESFRLLQKFDAGHGWQFQVRQDEVRPIGFQPPQRRFGALRLHANISERVADRHAQAADALLVIHNQ